MQELKQLMSDKSLFRDHSLDGGNPCEALCIEQRDNGQWQTYYSERGEKNSIIVFDTEEEACSYFYEWAKK